LLYGPDSRTPTPKSRRFRFTHLCVVRQF